MEKFVPLKENAEGFTHIHVRTNYSLGGINYFTYKNEARGYWLHITPVTKENKYDCRMISFVSSKPGIKTLLKEVTRKSAKAEAEAERLALNKEEQLIEHVCTKYGLELDEEFNSEEVA